jgi:putative MATE family efflux protein
MKHIQLSDHFKISTIVLFSLPSIGMQLVDNTYQVADGFFISNYIGEAAFEAENLIFPALLIVMYVGLMFGTGASALISRELGEGRREQASRILSMTVAVLAAASVLLSASLFFLMPAVARWVGASDALVQDCVPYGRVLAFFMPFQMLSMAFHPLLITAERPDLGLVTTVANALVNILLDWAFVAGFRWGMRGAAVATGIAWLISAVIPFVYFTNRKHTLHFTRPASDLGALGKTLYNGASEMVDGVSYAVVALIFNLQMLRYLGENGVGAYAVSEYVGGVFSAVFYGVSMSIVPVVGYHLGQKNKKELHSLRRNGLILMGVLGAAMMLLCLGLAHPISRIFVGYNAVLTDLSTLALRLISLSFLLGGLTTYSSSYFTGLNQGSASLAIAAVKGFAGPLAAVYLLPLLIGSNGLWLATPVAELLALGTALACFAWWNRNEDERIEKAAEETEE